MSKNMLRQKSPVKNSKSLQKLCAHGQPQEKLNSLEQAEDIADTGSIDCSELMNITKPVQYDNSFVTHGSVVPHKKKIWKDRLNPSELNSLTTKLSKILEVASISKEKDLKPFWNSHLEDRYKSLWLPTKTDSCDLVLSSSKQLSGTEMGKSWFSIKKKINHQSKNSVKTLSQSLQFSLPESTVLEVGKTGKAIPVQEKIAKKGKAKEGAVKSLRIRIFPREKEAWVNRIHQQSRWMYNAALNICYNTFEHVHELGSISENKLRDLVKQHKYVIEEDTLSNGTKIVYKRFELDENHHSWPSPPGEKILHNRIARGAVVSFARSLNSSLANLKAGNIGNFQMKYKSKKEPVHTSFFEDSSFPKEILAFKSVYPFTTLVNGRNKRTYMSFQEIFKQDKHPSGFILEHDTLTNKHYILYTVPLSWYPSTYRKCDSQVRTISEEPRIMALDPGVRTFLTGYDPAGKVAVIGEYANEEIFKLLAVLDDLYSKRSSNSNIVSNKELQLLQRKIKNLVKEMHWKAAKFLVSNWDILLLPYFRVAGMVRGKKLSKRTKRQLQSFSFYQFKQRCVHQCKKWKAKVMFVEEDYTSKTCGKCGNLNMDLGGSKIFHCEICDIEIDRDLNGARNIMLKNLGAVMA